MYLMDVTGASVEVAVGKVEPLTQGVVLAKLVDGNDGEGDVGNVGADVGMGAMGLLTSEVVDVAALRDKSRHSSGVGGTIRDGGGGVADVLGLLEGWAVVRVVEVVLLLGGATTGVDGFGYDDLICAEFGVGATWGEVLIHGDDDVVDVKAVVDCRLETALGVMSGLDTTCAWVDAIGAVGVGNADLPGVLTENLVGVMVLADVLLLPHDQAGLAEVDCGALSTCVGVMCVADGAWLRSGEQVQFGVGGLVVAEVDDEDDTGIVAGTIASLGCIVCAGIRCCLLDCWTVVFVGERSKATLGSVASASNRRVAAPTASLLIPGSWATLVRKLNC